MAERKVGFNYFEGLAAADKPTGVTPGSHYRETDTYLLWWTPDGDNWVLASNVMYNLAALEHYNHSRTRVYPQDIRLVAELVAAAANIFGDWIEIIPIDTVDFDYEVIGIVIEEADAATTYFVQLGFSLVDGTEPTEAQIAGERRALLPTPAVRATELLEIRSQNIPANAKLWGKVKSKAGGSETIGISVVIARHIEITNPVAKLATWPWST